MSSSLRLELVPEGYLAAMEVKPIAKGIDNRARQLSTPEAIKLGPVVILV
jgi:hypothetical protein